MFLAEENMGLNDKKNGVPQTLPYIAQKTIPSCAVEVSLNITPGCPHSMFNLQPSAVKSEKSYYK